MMETMGLANNGRSSAWQRSVSVTGGIAIFKGNDERIGNLFIALK
jgi:hypothetical protein